MGDGGLRFQVAGFPVSLPLGGLLGVLLIAVLWAPNFTAADGSSGLLLAAVFAVLLYASVFLHELAHAVAAQAFGYPVHGITLWLLGGYTVYERKRSQPWPELIIAVSGPLATLAIAAICWAIAGVTGGVISVLAGALAWTNLLLGILNLLPGAPLDGGGVIKALIWRVSGSESAGSRAAGYAGLVIAAALGAFALYTFAQGGTSALITLVVAGFIGFGAWQSLQAGKSRSALDRIGPQVPRLLRPVLAVAEHDYLGSALRRWDRDRQVGVVTVDAGGRLLAALSLPAADAVPEARRDEVSIGPFTQPIPADQRAVLDDDPAEPVMTLAQNRQSFVYVTDGAGRPLGVLTAADVNAALDAR